jgi:iron complex transport system substrate-binding protein
MSRKIIIALLALGLALSACAPAPRNITLPGFVDGLDRSIVLDGPAKRVVSLAPSNTEILFAVGAGAQTVGRDEFSDYPPEAKQLPSVGGSMGQYSTEAIVALKPDLVLAAEINSPEFVKQLEDLGLTVFYLKNPRTLEEMYANLVMVGGLTGKNAGPLVESLKKRVQAVDDKIMSLSARVSVFYEIDATDPSKPYTYGPGSFGDLLIARAGGYNIAHELSDPYPQMSLEQIVVANPSFILLGDSMWGTTPEDVKARPGWESIYAVQSGQILPIDDNLISRPGPRLVDGLEQLAELLRPGILK